jgi:2',3'-cyclic-nucleotide 2'-phosphodiesterase
MSSEIRVLLVGDAIGRPGREALKKVIPGWRREGRADFVIVNGENSAGGKGITQETMRALLAAGVDVVTTGNHVWANKDVLKIIDVEPRLLRPANFPSGVDVPGHGFGIFECEESGLKIGVINLIGRVFLDNSECPFRTARMLLQQIHEHTSIVFVDFHAEATSEKIALGWFLDGEVTCLFGTHTHVQTADERLLHQGTAYITDIGMTGAHDGVIGVKSPQVIERFLKGMPVKHEVAEGNVKLCGALVTVDAMTGKATAIERVLEAIK